MCDFIFISQNEDNKQEPMDADLPPLIPLPVERMLPSLAITPPAVRPNQLDLGRPTRPARHLRPPSVDPSNRRSLSPGRFCCFWLNFDWRKLSLKELIRNVLCSPDHMIQTFLGEA